MVRRLLLLTVLLATINAFWLFKSKEVTPVGGSPSYPIRAVFVNKMTTWYGTGVAAQLGLPGYAPAHDYNHIIFAFWNCQQGGLDVGKVWKDILTYVGERNPWGNSHQEVQRNMKKIYNDHGIKIMVSAFGSTEFPTTFYQDPILCGKKLGQFVLANNLDGADIDWEDNKAMESGKGQDWLIQFTRALREVIPNHIVSHAPQAPYFKKEHYPKGGYATIDHQIGGLIDFYLVQFYNQGDTRYNNYQELIERSTGPFTGTALMEIINRGVPSQKVVIAKPMVPSDAYNTGFMPGSELGGCVVNAYNKYGWFAGVAHWQYSSDYSGNTLRQAAGQLINLCKQSGRCH